jgi:ABC-type dipeptide/oligopeptide/nickel transport systems, permease components
VGECLQGEEDTVSIEILTRDEDGSQATAPDEAATGGVARMMIGVFAQNRLALAGLGTVGLILLFCFIGPLIYHTDQITTNPYQATRRPSGAHLLGTDELGYDVLGRLMKAGQSSLEVGLAAAVLASMLGTAWGAISGYFGGWVDAFMMRIVDAFLAIPPLLLVLLLSSMVQPSVPVLILVIGLVSWLITARLVRGDALLLTTREYVQAARLAGTSHLHIITKHIVPNVIGTVVVQTTFEVANAILLLAALGFLGLGPPPPSANWGGMLTNGLNYVYDGYWWLIYPAGVAIVLTVVGFNFIGDALRDSFEVRLQER